MPVHTGYRGWCAGWLLLKVLVQGSSSFSCSYSFDHGALASADRIVKVLNAQFSFFVLTTPGAAPLSCRRINRWHAACGASRIHCRLTT